MLALLAGLVLFFGVHSVSIAAPQWRDAMVAKLGESPWKGLYSLVSLGGFALMVHGYALTRLEPIALYWPPPWTRHLVALLMLPVFPLVLSAYLPGRIKTAAKHPMLAATKLWALAHLLANGMLGDVLLFGSFLLWAVLDRISLKRRPARATPSAPSSKWNDVLAVVLGLALYAAFVMSLHARWIGISPF